MLLENIWDFDLAYWKVVVVRKLYFEIMGCKTKKFGNVVAKLSLQFYKLWNVQHLKLHSILLEGCFIKTLFSCFVFYNYFYKICQYSTTTLKLSEPIQFTIPECFSSCRIQSWSESTEGNTQQYPCHMPQAHWAEVGFQDIYVWSSKHKVHIFVLLMVYALIEI